MSIVSPNTAPWSGAMQLIQKDAYPEKSNILFLPMNDTDSLVVRYVSNDYDESEYKVIPILTFDQPLWQKAYNIIRRESESSSL